MKNFPEKSSSSFQNGFWLVHKDGNDIIHFWMSSWSGMHKVYLNHELLITKRVWKLNHIHHFTNEAGNNYTITANVKNVIKGIYLFEFIKDGKQLTLFHCIFKKDNKSRSKRLIATVVLTILFVSIKETLKLPFFSFYIYLALLLVVLLTFTSIGKYEIIDEDEYADN